MYQTAKEKIQVKPVAITMPLLDSVETPAELLAYIARVSNPSNQNNHKTAEGLLRYCMKHGHYSVFEQVDVTMEILVPRDISRQIIRHRSGMPQEFSQRYADVTEDMFCTRELRLQDNKNRQNSITINSDSKWHQEWLEDQEAVLELVRSTQTKWRERGAAKEVARVLLPEGLTMSRMYFKAPVRSWIHYCKVRGEKGVTQEEHTWVADKCREQFKELLPAIYEMM